MCGGRTREAIQRLGTGGARMGSVRMLALAALVLRRGVVAQDECQDANTQCSTFLSHGFSCTQQLAPGVLLSDQCQLSCGECSAPGSDDGAATEATEPAPAPPDSNCRDTMSNCESLLTAGYPCSFEPVP